MKVKELRSLIFSKEEEAEQAKLQKQKRDFDFPEVGKTGGHKVVEGFKLLKGKEKKVNLEDFDFGTDMPKKTEKKTASTPKQRTGPGKTESRPPKSSDDFFQNSVGKKNNVSGNAKNNSSESHIVTNDDFNF